MYIDNPLEPELPPEADPSPEADPDTCHHVFGPDNLECELCGNTILEVPREPPPG
jgi:hypothetical protein